MSHLLQSWRKGLLAAEGLRGRFLRGAFWSVAAAVASQASNLLTGILVARLLGAEGYGEVAILVSTVVTFAWFAGLGAGMTATKYVAEWRTRDRERAGRIIALTTATTLVSGAAVAALLALAAPLLAERWLAAPHLVPELRWSALLVFLTAFAGVQTGILSGFEAFKTNARLNLIQGLVHIPTKLGGAYLFGVQGVIWGMVLTATLLAGVAQVAVHRTCRRAGIVMTARGMGGEAGVIFKFSLPTLVAGALAGPVMWLGNTVLVNSPDGYTEMGVFRAADQWRNLLIFLPVVLAQAILPMLSSLLGEGERRQARKLLLTTIGGLALVSAPVTAALLLAREPIMALYGPQFAGRGDVLIVVLLAALVQAVQTPVGQLIFASGHAWVAALINIVWAANFLGACRYFVAAGWGAAGLGMGYLVAYGVHLLLNSAVAWAILSRRPSAATR